MSLDTYTYNQFTISLRGDISTPKSSIKKLNSVYVYHNDNLPMIEVNNQQGELIGLLIGTVIDYEHETILTQPFSIDLCEDINQSIEDSIYKLSGNFIFILDHYNYKRVYLDTNGNLSLVYDPELAIAGSTASSILPPEQLETRFNRELYNHLEVDKEGWFPSGLTAHKGINRLLCNHYLNLVNFQPVRHWPLSNFQETHSVETCANQVSTIIEKTTRALLKNGTAICALTAGNETRYILSSLKEIKNKVDYFTIDFNKSSCDIYTARKISKALDIKWSAIPAIYSSDTDKKIWRQQVSDCISGNNLYIHKTLDQISDYSYFIGGLGGEIGRAFLWKADDCKSAELSPQIILNRLGLSHKNRELMSATESWFNEVSKFDALTILDLAYIELRMSAWAFCQAYANPKKQIEINPMVCREAYTLMLNQPAQGKKKSAFIKKGIDINCPELSDIPINKYGDHRDFLQLLRKVNPSSIKKKIRKIVLS